MRKIAFIACAVVLLTAAAAQAQTPQGDPQKGRAMFSGQGGSGFCMLCHGGGAQGGFGPGLAGGRGLSFEQFKRAVQQPWGVMPKFPNINDEGLAHIYAFLKSLPPAPEPATWSVAPAAATAPLGQQLGIQFGCGQCHGPENGHPRRDIGERGGRHPHAGAVGGKVAKPWGEGGEPGESRRVPDRYPADHGAAILQALEWCPAHRRHGGGYVQHPGGHNPRAGVRNGNGREGDVHAPGVGVRWRDPHGERDDPAGGVRVDSHRASLAHAA